MRIQFFGPLRELAGKETEIHLLRPARLREIIATLRKSHPGLMPHLTEDRASDYLPAVMFMRQGKPLKLGDIVNNDDEIKVLLPISGG